VLVPGNTIPDTPIITGYDFNKGRDLDGLMEAMLTSGFQATALGEAVAEVNRMVRPGTRQGDALAMLWARAAQAARRHAGSRPAGSLQGRCAARPTPAPAAANAPLSPCLAAACFGRWCSWTGG
jgi:hypothetical protein